MVKLISSGKTILSKTILTLFALLSTLSLYPQQYNFENFTLESGLPQSTIYCMFQDSRGYIWLGTEGSGVCRFDGKEFQPFNLAQGLAGNIVRSILEDKKGRLWFGTDAGISVYDGRTFFTIDEKKGLSSNTVVCLYIDKRDSIWAGTAGEKGGLNKIELTFPDSVKITKYSVDDGLLNNNVFALAEDNFNRLWIGTFGGGIAIRSKDGKEGLFYLNTLNNFPSDHILTMSADSLNNLWIGTYDKGIVKITVSNDLKLSKIEQPVYSPEISNNAVWSIWTGSNDIWAGTNESGILIIRGNTFSTINISNGLLKNQIISIFKDRENNVWVSSGDGGISRFLGDRFFNLTKKEGLTDENVYSIARTTNGDIWIGTYGGGLYRVILKDGHYIFNNFTIRDGLPDNAINSLAPDINGNIWIATPKGIVFYNGRKFRVFTEENDGLVNNYVNTICIDKDGIVWCGTKKGISIYDGIGFKNTRVNYMPNGEVQTILQDRSGNVWCGTLGGLAKFHGDKLTTYDEAEGLTQMKIHSLAEDKNGNIWIATFGGGIFKFSVDTNDKMPIRQLLTDSLLNSLNVYSLIFENDSTLLAGTDKGLNRIILDNNFQVKKVFNYGLKDGFTGIKNNLNAVVKNGDEIWFGTVNGITVYRPEADKMFNSKPKIHISNLKLFFNDVDWKKENYEIIPWTNLPRNLKLSYKNNHLTFIFTGLLFQDKEEITYQYILEGLDKNWSPPRKENEAVYPGLQHGEYTFKVVALDRYGNRSDEVASFSFIITPPFWKTTWFFILCTIIVISSIIGFIKYRERKLRNERDLLERIVKERTAEVVRQKDQIEYQRDEIQIQHNLVTEQKKDIMDSIQYAKRIQTAAIPSEDKVLNELNDLFILYMPRDVVSGDFYWLGIEDGKVIIIAADCTGHGVPGAFTSMLGISMLNDIIGKESTTSPDIILNELRNNIIRSLKQSPDGDSKDGMDIVILTIDKENKEIDFAGAINPLFVIRESDKESINDLYIEEGGFRLYEIKGDKMPAAIHSRMDPFRKTTIKFRQDDKFYIMSDGYEDQFGGPHQRKFMKKNLKKLLLQIHHLPMNEQKQFLENTLENWKSDLSQIDDILVIGFSI